MPSETLSTVFSAKENVSDALENISEAAATAKQTLESADESLSDLDDSLDNATVSSEGFRSAVNRAEDATEELGDSAVQTAVEVQSLNASFSTLQTPEFDNTGFRRIDDMVSRARDSIRELSTADTRDLREEFEQVASQIENISRIDLGKNLQEPLTEAEINLEGVRDTWDEFDEGIAQGNVYEILNNIRQFEDSVDELSEKNVIDPEVDLDDVGERLRRRIDEADFDPQITDQFFNEDKIRNQLTSVEEELDDFEDQRLISGESVEARNIRDRIQEVRNTLEDDEMEMPARVESLSDDLAQLRAETQAFEEAEEVTIETDVESATSVEKFQRLANTAAQLQDEIGNIEAEIDAASVTDAERRVSSIRNTLDETGGSLDGIREAFDEFDDLTADVDIDSIDDNRVEDLRERVNNIGDISVEPREVLRDLQRALQDIEQEVSIDPEVEGLEEARERVARVTEIIENEDIEIDVAVERIQDEFAKISQNISEVEREIDEIEVDVDVNTEEVEEAAQKVEGRDIKKSIDLYYDRDTLDAAFNTLREIDSMEVGAEIDNISETTESINIPVTTDISDARARIESFIQGYESRSIDIPVDVRESETIDVDANVDVSDDEIENIVSDVKRISSELREGDGTFDERFESVKEDLDDIQNRVSRLRRSSGINIISGKDELSRVDSHFDDINESVEKNINSGARANSVYSKMRRLMSDISDVEIETDDPDISTPDEKLSEISVIADTSPARARIEEFIQEYQSREIDISVNTSEIQANANAIRNALDQRDDDEIEYEASSSMFTNLIGREGVEEKLEDAFSGVESLDEFEESLTEFNARVGLSESRVESLRNAFDGLGSDAIQAAIQQETLEDALFELERQGGVAERNIDEVGQAINRMSISSSASVAPVLAAASALDQLEEKADEADDAIDLDNIESLGLGLRSASLNIGALNVGLTQMATTIPAIVTLIGSLAVALGGLATAALLAGGAIAAIFAGGVLYQAENLAAASEDIEGTMEGVSEVMSNVGELFQRAFEPLKDIGAFGMFRNFVEGAAEALNMMLQAVANMRGEINQLNSSVGDAFWSNFEALIVEMQDTIIAFMPVLISLTEWLMENLPEALDFMQSEGMRFMGTLAELSAVLVRFFVVLSEFGVTAFNAVMPVLTAMIGLFDRFINAINALPNSVIQAVASFAAILVVTRGIIGIGRQAIGTFADLGIIFTSVAGKGGVLRGAIATLGGAIAQFLGFGQQFALWLSAGGDAAIANATATGVLTSAYASLRASVITTIGTLKGYAAAAWTSYVNTLTLSNVMATGKWAVLGLAGSVKTAAVTLWGYVTGIGAAITGTWSYIAALAANVASLIGFIATALVTEGVLYTLGAAFGAAAAGATLLSFALDLLGIGLIIKAVVLLIAVLGGLAGIIAHSDAIMGALRDTWDAVAGTLITVFNVLMKIGVPVFNLFIETLEFFAAIGLAVIDVLKGIFNTIFGAGAAGNMMSAMFSGLAEMISSLDDMIAGFFEALVKGMEKVNSMINEIPGVDVDTSPFEGAKIETEDAQLDQGPLMGGEGKSDGKMSPDKMEQQNVYNQNDITHNNYDMTMNANAEQQATIERLVKDAISEASRKERLRQGYSG